MQQKKKNQSYGRIIWLVLFVVLFFSNPSHEQHRYAIKTEVKAEYPLFGVLGGGKFIANQAVYQDYFFFSSTSIKGESVSIGLLGNIWVELPEWIENLVPFQPRA